MINIVIVDDDVLALTKLKQLIQLKNTRIVGEFTQAEEAEEYILKNTVHILLTDMRMPKIDGIELIRKVKVYKPELQVVAISSYKDFDYVKESFKQGSIDYILKHNLNEETLLKALTEACINIKSNDKKADGNFLERSLIQESKEALRGKLLIQLLKEEITVEEAKDKFDKYKIQLDISSTIVVVCEIDDYKIIIKDFTDKDKGIFLNAVRDLIERIITKVPEKEIIRIEEGRYILFLSYTNVKSHLYIYSTTLEYCRRLNDNLKKMLNLNLSVGIGECCTDLKDFIYSYNKCMEMIKDKFFEGKGQVYDSYNRGSNVASIKNDSTAIKLESESIYESLNTGDNAYVKEINKIFNQYKALKYPIQVVELNIVEILNIGYKVIKANHFIKLEEEQGFNEVYKHIKSVETIDEIENILLAFYNKINESILHLNDIQNKKYSKHTVKAIKYIENYYKELISLQDIADTLGVNNTYLSKVFKIDTGSNLTEYINRYRIEKAKELIETQQYKIKDVYQMVGFSQYNYFFKVFKQLIECTPLEYEKKITK